MFDRFHVMKHVLAVVDEVRKSEHRELSDCGEQTLKGTRYLWLCGAKRIFHRGDVESLRH
ncbi:MAG: transposase [Nitrospirae bacterium]|nr:transposase [Nitrospirota bacterium]